MLVSLEKPMGQMQARRNGRFQDHTSRDLTCDRVRLSVSGCDGGASGVRAALCMPSCDGCPSAEPGSGPGAKDTRLQV